MLRLSQAIRSTSDAALKRVASRSYRTARAYHRLRIRRAFRNDPRPVVILQMGKVGSSTIHASLSAACSGRELWQVHYLSDEIISRLRTVYRQAWRHAHARGLWTCEYLRERIDSGWTGFKIITLVRDPVARNVSAFFQTCTFEFRADGTARRVRSIDYGFDVELDPQDLGALAQLFLERFDHDTPLVYFDREFKGVLDIDVFARPFPTGDGYSLYPARRADLLVMRLEDLRRCAAPAMKQFLDLNGFALLDANVGREKQYSEIYERFKRTVHLPVWYLDDMYTSKYARHFYTQDEIRQFRDTWSR